MKIIHLADLHLGYRAYSKINAQGLNIREADVYKAFKNAVDKIISLNPDLILIAGDIFHVVRPSNTAIRVAIQLFSHLRNQTSAPVVMISGNHESPKTTESGSILQIFSDIFDQFYVFDSTVGSIPVKNTIKVTCIPHTAMELQNEFIIKPDPAFCYNILMIHGTAQEEYINDFGGYDIANKNEFFNDPWDYIALGHYHNHTKIKKNIYYSGAIERTSFNIWKETDAKGFIEYNLETQKHVFHPLDVYREVKDLETIWAEHYTSVEEINNVMLKQVNAVKGGIDNKIIRLRIFNLPSSFYSGLDFESVRKWRQQALHFKLSVSKLEDTMQNTQKENLYYMHTNPIDSQLNNFIDILELPANIEKDYLKTLGQEYYTKRVEMV